MRNGYVYKITVGRYYYYGRTIQPVEKRWHRHLAYLRNNNHVNKFMQNCYNKYGAAAFSIETVVVVRNIKYLDNAEHYYIRKHVDNPDCMNIRRYKDAIVKRDDFTEEHKRKISEAKTGARNWMYGKTGSQHHASKKIAAVSPTGRTYHWPSTIEASKQLGVKRSTIAHWCRGSIRPSHKLFPHLVNWRFYYA